MGPYSSEAPTFPCSALFPTDLVGGGATHRFSFPRSSLPSRTTSAAPPMRPSLSPGLLRYPAQELALRLDASPHAGARAQGRRAVRAHAGSRASPPRAQGCRASLCRRSRPARRANPAQLSLCGLARSILPRRAARDSTPDLRRDSIDPFLDHPLPRPPTVHGLRKISKVIKDKHAALIRPVSTVIRDNYV